MQDFMHFEGLRTHFATTQNVDISTMYKKMHIRKRKIVFRVRKTIDKSMVRKEVPIIGIM